MHPLQSVHVYIHGYFLAQVVWQHIQNFVQVNIFCYPQKQLGKVALLLKVQTLSIGILDHIGRTANSYGQNDNTYHQKNGHEHFLVRVGGLRHLSYGGQCLHRPPKTVNILRVQIISEQNIVILHLGLVVLQVFKGQTWIDP
ncbi:hypothetical protein BpHYR1_012974 [Brachionus plicatilis]|uniref:Uncharacterized protein n=1 Tax=Brachionus plicatilis TaxID=10195 RepID=A0A3M7P8Q7_BRAPC|nr:hypothetical protein BpHYR1_012974 [Brachionus plicatilis]